MSSFIISFFIHKTQLVLILNNNIIEIYRMLIMYSFERTYSGFYSECFAFKVPVSATEENTTWIYN